MKLEKVVQLNSELVALLKDYKMSMIPKFHLNKLLEAVAPDALSFSKIREDYIKEHGNYIVEMNYHIIPKEKEKEFSDEMEKLLQQEIDLKLPTIKLSVFEKIEDSGTGNFPVLFSLIEE